ncbi:MAG: hypothetical protein ACM34I_05905 [bacterium]
MPKKGKRGQATFLRIMDERCREKREGYTTTAATVARFYILKAYLFLDLPVKNL